MCGVSLYNFQLLIRHGMPLENIICESNVKKEFSESRSFFFWFTVLRKLYIATEDETIKEEFKETAFILQTQIENHFQDVKFKKLLPRTTRLFIAVEQKNHDEAKRLLEEYPHNDEFLPYMILIPGAIFPFGSSYHEGVVASPLGKLSIFYEHGAK